MSVLKMALRQIKAKGKEEEGKKKKKDNSALEQAMKDFTQATSPADRAAAFTAALELAKSE